MSYTADTEYAIRHLIELTTREENMLRESTQHLISTEQRLRVHQWDFETSDLNDDFSEAYVMAAHRRASQAGDDANVLIKEVSDLRASIGFHQLAVQAICGATLQIVKQGLSLVHGGLAATPNGRTIGTASLKDVVWQGRNQAIHFEEGRFNQPVTELFARLEASHGHTFSLAMHPRQSLAKQVVHLLGWLTYQDYLRDAQLLGL